MTNVLKVSDFEKLANSLGLIPMKFLRETITEYEGDIRGAEPATALRWYNEGLAEPLSGTPTAAAVIAPVMPDSSTITYDTTVTIPDGWRELHGLKRVGLARELLNDPQAKIKAADADKVIAEALAQRAAASLADNPDTGTGTGTEALGPETGNPAGGDLGTNALTSRSLGGE